MNFFESVIAEAITESKFPNNFKELRNEARSIYFKNLTNPSQTDINYAVFNVNKFFFV